MLSALSVRDIVLIDRLDLQLDRGLMVLTGETGAGKSILLDALSLALGARGDQSLVRVGAAQGQVTAIFELPTEHEALALLKSSEIEVEGALILRRVQFADGRSKAFVNDQPVSARLLQQLGSLLIEIHGQHADRALIDASTHRALLDAFGGHDKLVRQVAACYEELVDLERQLDAQKAKVARIAREEDFARHAVEELTKFFPSIGEEDELSARRHDLMQLEKAADDVRDADELLHGPNSPTDQIATLMRRLERKGQSEDGLYAELMQALGDSMDAMGRSSDALEDIKRKMMFDPQELNQVEERLFDLRALARKHDVSCDELLSVQSKYETELELLKSGGEELDRLEQAVSSTKAAYFKIAAELSAKRIKSAGMLEKSVMRELPDLKLGSARFLVDHDVQAERIAPQGLDLIAFHVQTNPGTRAGPMLKVASGGELSRFLLALKVVLADKGSAPVLIFDEIDTGVGGAVADAMGRRLSRLAEKVQVLTVTHAPQVAARASQHLLIEKQNEKNGKSTRTLVHALEQVERDEEMARMLAGAEITEEARAAAKRLIAEVR